MSLFWDQYLIYCLRFNTPRKSSLHLDLTKQDPTNHFLSCLFTIPHHHTSYKTNKHLRKNENCCLAVNFSSKLGIAPNEFLVFLCFFTEHLPRCRHNFLSKLSKTPAIQKWIDRRVQEHRGISKLPFTFPVLEGQCSEAQ